jgi:3-deoxy-D-manno-octulosonic-acid transferase
VGGSFNPKVGGHNILEPAYYGVPVLYGPCMHSQPNFLDLMRAYRAGIQVTQDNLTHHLVRLLEHPHKRYELGKNGRKLIHEAKGALEKTYHAISPYLPKKNEEVIAVNSVN